VCHINIPYLVHAPAFWYMIAAHYISGLILAIKIAGVSSDSRSQHIAFPAAEQYVWWRSLRRRERILQICLLWLAVVLEHLIQWP